MQTQHITGQLNTRDVILFAFGDVDRDKDILFIRSDGNLDTVNFKVQITVIKIIRANRFNIGCKLFTRIEVALRVPAHPTRGRELHLFLQLFVIHHSVADKADRFNAGRFAFINHNRESHAVAIQRRHRCLNVHPIVTAGQILTAHFLVSAIQSRMVKNSTFG